MKVEIFSFIVVYETLKIFDTFFGNSTADFVNIWSNAKQ